VTRSSPAAPRPAALALVLVAGTAVAAGCAPRQQAQVLAPVRIDASTIGNSPAPNAPAPAGGGAGATPGSGDPFQTFSALAGGNGIDWPGPNQYRSASGAPGPAYWQQRADYAIQATLDTANGGAVSGAVTIRYTNNSPDTLRFLWVQLDQNLYRPGSKGSSLFPADSRWGVRGFRGGYDLADVAVDGRPVQPRVDDTMMRLDLARPLAPRGGRATVSMRFRFAVPEHGSDRMGRDSALFEIAQWYPRMAVYDDVRGWNTDPYLGQGEFYLEYGDIDYAVTAPAGYVIAGSGVLQNPEQVLTAEQRARLARARGLTAEPGRAETVAQVITEAEAAAARTRRAPGTKTWRFRAENVRDVAWAGAPDFRWDATSWNGIACHAYYQFPKAGRAWEGGAEQTCWSMRTYSTLWFPYPYPQATSVAGPVGGMEYPMFVMVHYGTDDPASVFGTIDHEQGHEWFPMLVGSNERRYGWQDEGLNTYINAFSNERRYPGQRPIETYLANWRQVVANRTQAPLMTPPDRVESAALGAIAYRKPGAVLLALRDQVLDPETFDRALREYVRRWAYKHPTPGDFFRTVENVSGRDLAWFWRSFWYTTDVLDIAVEGATTRAGGAGGGESVSTVALRRRTSVPFPVTMRLRLADGSTRDVRAPVELWGRPAAGDRVEVSLALPAAVTGVRLWPSGVSLDFDASNDTWGNAPPADPPGPATGGGLSGAVGR